MSRTWIVGYDFSQEAARALERAALLLTGLGGGRLLMVHVYKVIGVRVGVDGAAIVPEFDDLEETMMAEARKAIAEHVAPVAARYPALTVEGRVELGNPGEVLAGLAASEHAEQLVVGSHGRRGVERFFLGSVAERVLRLADVPVLVVKGGG